MDSVVASFLEEDADGDFSEDIHFSDEDIPEVFSQMVPKRNRNLGVNINRKRFLQMAPSLMQLIQHGKYQYKSINQPTTIDFHGSAHGDYQSTPPLASPPEDAPIEWTNTDAMDDGKDGSPDIDKGNGSPNQKSHSLKSPESPYRSQDRRGGSVVDELLAAQISESMNVTPSVDIQELANKAAFEFEQLGIQNDILYRESEKLMNRFKEVESERDRLQSMLEEERCKSSDYKQEMEALQRSNESLRNEIDSFHSEINGISSRLSNDSLLSNGKMEDDDKAMIDKLQSELLQLKTRVSHQEEDQQQAVQRLMDLTVMGQSNNDKLKQQLDDDEYEVEVVEEVVEVEVTDDEDEDEDGNDGNDRNHENESNNQHEGDGDERGNGQKEVIDSDEMIKALESKQKMVQTLLAEKEEFERTVSGLAHQNKQLLNHVEELESMLKSAHSQKETMEQRMEQMTASKTTPHDFSALHAKRRELEQKIQNAEIEYNRLTQQQEQDRIAFANDLEIRQVKKQQSELEIEDLQSQMEEYRDLKRLSEQNRVAESARLDMIESLNTTVATLEAELKDKNEALKREKDAQYELMDKLSQSQERMDELTDELKEVRTSSSQQQYRNHDRVKQLEMTIIDLNHQMKEYHDNMQKAKSVILLLRDENREIEEELGGLHLEIERDTEDRLKRKRKSMHQIQAVVHKLGGSDLIDEEFIAQKLNDLAVNVNETQTKWREKEREYKRDIDRLTREQQEMTSTLREAVVSKLNSLSLFNEQMEELRRVIKAQEIQMVRIQNRSLWFSLIAP